jgi:hypothetical protein
MNAKDKTCTCLGLRSVLLCSVAAVAVVVLIVTQDGTEHFAIDNVPPPASAPGPGVAAERSDAQPASPALAHTAAADKR